MVIIHLDIQYNAAVGPKSIWMLNGIVMAIETRFQTK